MILAQVTDTHVVSGGKLVFDMIDTADRLLRCVEHLNRLDPRPDVVVMTGDLVESGRPEEYRNLRRILAALEQPIYVIPGNHDDRRALREAFADQAYLPADSEFLHYTIDIHPVRLIGLDTTVPGVPWGELCWRRLSWLDDRLKEQPDQPTVLLMHHPPFRTGLLSMDWQNCRQGEELGKILHCHPQVIRILCGHVHRAIQVHWQGVIASTAPSTAHAVAFDLRRDSSFDFILEPPACQIHHWQKEIGLVSHLSFIGDYGERYPFDNSVRKRNA
ncbi:MAG: phosphodiesterase [Acidimicrobiia bacterium]|nr:phosphodiesterase [Acidimicrobiia bacterium]